MKCTPRKQFHLSPNEAFADSVSKLRGNKLLPANINEICSLIAKQVNLSTTVFHDQVRGERLSQSFMCELLYATGLVGSFTPLLTAVTAFSQQFHTYTTFCSSLFVYIKMQEMDRPEKNENK